MSSRRGFTLIEVLIVVAILLVLAGIVHPLVDRVGDQARPAVMATTVRQVRDQIRYHAGLGDGPMSAEGFPNSIEPAWFTAGMMPEDVWTRRPLSIQVVHGSKDATVPPKVTFVIKPDGRPAGHTAWYNAANGSFCIRVPKLGTPPEQQALFAEVNGL